MATFNYLPGDSRISALPSCRPEITDLLSKMKKSFWTEDEIKTNDDLFHFKNCLTNEERIAIRHIVAFFANSDGLVNVNIVDQFRKEIKMADLIFYYNFQATSEDIHALVYAEILNTIIEDPDEQAALLDAVSNFPIIKKLSDFMLPCLDTTIPIAERLLRAACTEGIHFQGPFKYIYWLAGRGLMPGLTQSNELISRDEHLHTVGHSVVHSYIVPHLRVTTARAHAIVADAVSLGKEFNHAAIPRGSPGMTVENLNDSSEIAGNNVLALFNIAPLYVIAARPMDKINLTHRNNNFEHRNTNYGGVESKETEYIAEVY